MINGNIKFDMLFKRGDTTTINLTLKEPLGDKKLKLGLFDTRSRLLWSITIPDDHSRYKSDAEGKNYLITLTHNVTKEFIGDIIFRSVLFDSTGHYVNSAEQIITLRFVDEPINKNLY
jgi:hypothetical protein